MFAAYRQAGNSAAAYGRVAVETGVAGARPVDLVVMVHEGAIEALARALVQMKAGEIATKNASITRAIRIIDEGLRATLEPGAGPLGDNLGDLYEYMMRRLLTANLRNDPAMIEEVSNLLCELKSAWNELATR